MTARRALIGVAMGVAAALVWFVLGRTATGTALENLTYDARVRATAHPADARRDIVIVEINDSSIRALEPVFGRWPWPRVVHAGLIDYLHRAGARVIAYDVLFLDADTRARFPVGDRQMSGAESDAAFAASLTRAGNVVLLADATYEGLQSGADAASLVPASLPGRVWHPDASPAWPSLRLPLPALASAAAAIGHNAYIQDERDRGTARRFVPFLGVGPHAVPSLGTAAALVALGVGGRDVTRTAAALSIGRTTLPVVDDGRVLLRYTGAYLPDARDTARRLYRTESAFDVLLSEEKASAGETPVIDPSVFKDKVVFVGVGAAGLHDVVVTPFTESGSTPGVFLHAVLADQILSGRATRPSAAAVDVVVAVLAGVGTGLAALFLPVWAAVATALALAVMMATTATAVFARGWWMPVAVPFGIVAMSAFAGTAWQYFVEGREKRRITQLFGRYVSRSVVEQLQRDPSLAVLGGTRREMSVLFSDIRGFTAASEHAAPEAVVAQLNEYFTAMVRVLHTHQGTLDKFVGDMVMGLFGAPVPDPAHADHAVDTARAMVAELAQLNARWRREGRPTLEIGIGVNSGEMIAGNIGADTIMSYTVIGDAVNLASRLESLNKEFGTRIIISDATRRQLSRVEDVRPLGDVTVKGRSQPVAIFEVRS